MKKLLLSILTLTLMMSLCGCNKEEEKVEEEVVVVEEESYDFEMSEGRIKELNEAGYTIYCDSYDDTSWKGILSKNDESYILIELEMTEEIYSELDELDFGSENYWYNRFCVLSEAEVLSEEDISSYLPSEEELNSYIGMSVGKLMDSGFEDMGYNWGDGEYILYFSGPHFDCQVEISNPISKDMDDISENEKRSMIIGKMTCNGLSTRILYETEEDISE